MSDLPSIGRLVAGKWRVESTLGRGGTSKVYRVVHADSGRVGALKVLLPELARHPRVVKMLLAEAKMIGAIDHPGIVKVLDDGIETDGLAFLVFELLVGESLEDLREARGGRVPLDEVMRIGDAVMDALAAVHASGVVHRDLKPANIHVLEGGGIKLLDFGFAKQRGYTADAAQSVVGTASFMSPEAALGLTKKIDAKSDIWSLGATLFFVLSGQSVHIGEHMDAMMLASANVKPRSLADAAPELPSAVIAVVDRALAYQKAERWPDVATMRGAWQKSLPHWIDTLPPPKFHADPGFLDTSLLVDEPPSGTSTSALFDPRQLLEDSVKPSPPKPKKPPPPKPRG
ncbi:MAG TPA: serine/threonine-protein kinase [Labilithrix sp.]|jgi:serine/threonine-protein kinase